MTIGDKITKLRLSKKMSQEKLAGLLNVSRQAVSRWESGESTPHIDTILELCDIFQISSDQLLREDVSIRVSRPCMLDIEGDIKLKYFGTDGFRGEANVQLTTDHAYKIGRFLGWYYSQDASDGVFSYRPKVVIGKDTRRSSYALEYAVACGLASSGAEVALLHVTTTPSISYVIRQDGFDCGVMITASHNPFYDNGIKIINSEGEKFDDRIAYLIECYLDGNLAALGIEGDDLPFATKEGMGSIGDYSAGRNRYIGYLISLAKHSFRTLKIGLDCANGASWMIAKSVFDALGAQTTIINASPDGFNINRDAGSTHIEGLQKLVKENHLDVGFAFDGDCDRCLAVDEKGRLVDGDKILYLLATKLKNEGALEDNAIVATIMSNSGLAKALKKVGIRLETTGVGDRFVYERMQQKNLSLGGEQSGHVIMKKYATTGDGVLTAIMVTEAMLEAKSPLSALVDPMKPLPQRTKNVRVIDKALTIQDEKVQAVFKAAEREIGDSGRILLRQSGTEPLIRITAECETLELCDQYIDRIYQAIVEGGYVSE